MKEREIMESKAAHAWIYDRFGVDESQPDLVDTKNSEDGKIESEQIYDFVRGKEVVIYTASEGVNNMNA